MGGTRIHVLEALNVIVFGENTLDHRLDVVFHAGGDDAWEFLVQILNVVSYVVCIAYHVRIADIYGAIHVQIRRRNLVRDAIFVETEIVHDVVLDNRLRWYFIF